MHYTYFVGKQGNYEHPSHVQVYTGPDIDEALHGFLLAIEEGDEYVVLEALREEK